jgi:hypothetical protein
MQRMPETGFGGVIALALSLLVVTSAYAAPLCSSLITPPQAAAALGVPEVKGGTGTELCEWVPGKYAPGPSKNLVISILSAKGYEAYARLPSMPGRIEITPVGGIGDGAIQQTLHGTRTVLMVKKADNYISVSVSGLPVDQAKSAEQILAKQILQKL